MGERNNVLARPAVVALSSAVLVMVAMSPYALRAVALLGAPVDMPPTETAARECISIFGLPIGRCSLSWAT